MYSSAGVTKMSHAGSGRTDDMQMQPHDAHKPNCTDLCDPLEPGKLHGRRPSEEDGAPYGARTALEAHDRDPVVEVGCIKAVCGS